MEAIGVVEGSPTKVLIVSADMGEGHNATGRALEQAARRRWPGCEVRWLDTLDVMGRAVGPAFRWIYVTNVQSTPWLYEFFYSSQWRIRWFNNSSKRFVGSWCGRRLIRHIDEFAPDIVLSTYPLGSAGFDWLRRHRPEKVANMRIGAWVSDFAPHPFWVYPKLDQHFVMHDNAVRVARQSVPTAPVITGAVPVVDAFHIGDRDQARRALDLPRKKFIALISCGSLGFGDVTQAVQETLAAAEDLLVIVACGRNDHLREKLDALGDSRVLALGWTDRMAQLTSAADVIITNAGGATSLEALACGRAVLMYRPIAAHGRANATLMADSGLAEIAETGELTGVIRRLINDPETLSAIEKTATEHARSRTISDDLALLEKTEIGSNIKKPENGESAAETKPHTLRPADAMFLHVATPEVPQQTGAVLMLDQKADGSSATVDDVAYLLSAGPNVLGRLDAGGPFRRPRWRADPDIDMAALIDEVTADDLVAAMDEFFSVGVTAHDPVAGRLVHGLPGGQSALMFRFHHALGDGMVVIWSLVARTRGETFVLPAERSTPTPEATASPPVTERAKSLLGKGKLLATGLARLASGGRAPHTPLDGSTTGPARRHGVAEFSAEHIRGAAASFGVRRTDFLLAVIAEALHRTIEPGERVRTVVTRSTREAATFRRAGNYTGAASVDLPTAAMPFAERATRTRAALRRQIDSGAPQTAELVLRLIGIAPPWLHARLARLMYSSTWFNAITSMLPGDEGDVVLRGARVRLVYPVLALAPGVGLSVGMMTWRDRVSIGLSAAPGIASMADELIAAIRAVIDEVTGDMPDAGADDVAAQPKAADS